MTSTPITWFEIGTDRPDEVQGFYAELFGWAFTEEGTATGGSYRTTGAGQPAGIGGGIRAIAEGAPATRSSTPRCPTWRRRAGGPRRRAARCCRHRGARRPG